MGSWSVPGFLTTTFFNTSRKNRQLWSNSLWTFLILFNFCCFLTKKIPNQTCDCTSSLQFLCSSSVSPPCALADSDLAASIQTQPYFTHEEEQRVCPLRWLLLSNPGPKTLTLKLAWCWGLSPSQPDSLFDSLSLNPFSFLERSKHTLWCVWRFVWTHERRGFF